MSNHSLKDILSGVLNSSTNFDFLYVMTLGTETTVVRRYGDEKYVWSIVELKNNGSLLCCDVIAEVTSASDILDVMKAVGMRDGAYSILRNTQDVEMYIRDLDINTEDDPHRSYFQVLNEVVSSHNAAVEEMHVFLERVASGQAELFNGRGGDSKEYSLYVANLTKTFCAVQNTMTNIAEVHFSEKK